MTHCTTHRSLAGLLVLLLVAAPAGLEAQGIREGKVSQLAGRRAGVALAPGGPSPVVGDSAQLFDASLPGEAPIPVRGRWRVVEVTSDIAWLEPDGSTVEAVVGYLARIHLSVPGTQLPPAIPPSVPPPPGEVPGPQGPAAAAGSAAPVPALPATRELRLRRVRNLGELALPRDAKQLGPEWRWSAGPAAPQSIRVEFWPRRAHTQDAASMLAYLWPRHSEEVLGIGVPVARWENRALEGRPECLSNANHLGGSYFVLVICPGGDPRELTVFQGTTGRSEAEEATIFAIIRSFRAR